jgi:hypothetical protein
VISSVQILFTLLAVATLFLGTFPSDTNLYGHAYAQSGKESVVVSSLLGFEDETLPQYNVNAGETVILKGNIRSFVMQDMTVSINVRSDAVSPVWEVVSKKPSDAFNLPAAESIPYEFEVRFSTPGTFSLQLDATILEIPNRPVPIDANSPDCSGCRINVTTVTVTEPVGSYTMAIATAAAVAAALGGLSIWYFYHRSKQKSTV